MIDDWVGHQTDEMRRRHPLYFLDYETLNFAVPPLTGFRSYQQFVFQYSLHIQRSLDGPLEHHEFLANGVSDDQIDQLCQSLRDSIADDNGSKGRSVRIEV